MTKKILQEKDRYKASIKKIKGLQLIALNIIIISFTYQYFKMWYLEFEGFDNKRKTLKYYFRTAKYFQSVLDEFALSHKDN